MELIKYDPESDKMLANMDQASYALVQARSIAEVKHVHDIAEAAKRYAKAADLCNEAYVMASVVAADARRKAGEMLMQLERKPGARTDTSSARGRGSEYAEVLKDVSLPIQTAHKWQQEARVPEPVYQEIKNEALEKGVELSQRSVLKVAKKDEREQQIEQVRQKIEQEELIAPTGKFDVIAIDPPWAYDEKGGFSSEQHDSEGNRGGVDYPTMTVEQIGKIDLPSKDDSVLFLWTTHAFLRDAFELLDRWKYNYKATIVWDKEKMGMGRNIRMQCEFCLLATKGKPIINGASERDIIREARREHSRKPEAFYTMVDRMCIGKKLDYFSREQRTGWDTYGAEADKF
jgi:N6-adenosine-specific RNA methylase IME4